MNKTVQYIVYYAASYRNGGEQRGFMVLSREGEIASHGDVGEVNSLIGDTVKKENTRIVGVCITGINRLPI